MKPIYIFQKSVFCLTLISLICVSVISQTKGNKSIPKPSQNKSVLRQDFNQSGIEYFKSGDLINARLMFEKSLRQNPKNVESHTYLGIIADQSGDFEQAEKHFSLAAKYNPKSASARNNYGAILLRQKKNQLAQTEFTASLRLNPDQSNALINLAQIKFEENTTASLNESLILFERADALTSDFLIARSLLITSLKLKKNELANSYYEKYKTRLEQSVEAKNDLSGRLEIGTVLYEAKLLELAEQEVKEYLVITPNDKTAILLLGNIYLARKDINSAGKTLEMAVAQNNATAAIYSLLSTVYEKSGHFENAIPAMRLAIQLEPESEIYRFQYGLLLTNAEAPAAAIIRLDEALKAFPNSSRIWLAKGIAYLKDNKNVEAIQSIEKALGIDAKFAQAYAYLGLAQMQIAQYDKAVIEYEKALNLNPNISIVHQMIAEALLQKTDADNPRIESELKKSIAADAQYIPAYSLLGKFYIRNQRWLEALDAFDKVLKIDPNSADAYYQLGRIYTRLKRKTEASEALAKFKILNETQKTKSESDLRELVKRLSTVYF